MAESHMKKNLLWEQHSLIHKQEASEKYFFDVNTQHADGRRFKNELWFLISFIITGYWEYANKQKQ